MKSGEVIGSTHNHSTGSDGKLSPEEVILKAIELRWDYVYFTDHYLLPPDFPLKGNRGYFNKEYIKDVKKLREKYKDKIKIYFGAEFNWFEDYSKWLRKEAKKDFDYVIGSIHFLFEKNGKFRLMEQGRDYYLETLRKFGGVKGYVQEYYKQTKNLIKSEIYDSVGHFDYVKIYNKNKEFFSEDDAWYEELVLECLDLMKGSGMVLEINAGGFGKCGASFPSEWIVKEARKRNIPITLGLDAHQEEHFDNKACKKMINIAKKAGYKSIS